MALIPLKQTCRKGSAGVPSEPRCRTPPYTSVRPCSKDHVHELRDRLRAEHSELARLRAELAALRAGETSKDVQIEKFKLTAYAARDELEAGPGILLTTSEGAI